LPFTIFHSPYPARDNKITNPSNSSIATTSAAAVPAIHRGCRFNRPIKIKIHAIETEIIITDNAIPGKITDSTEIMSIRKPPATAASNPAGINPATIADPNGPKSVIFIPAFYTTLNPTPHLARREHTPGYRRSKVRQCQSRRITKPGDLKSPGDDRHTGRKQPGINTDPE
jgi:hypothetical protein